MAGLFAQYLAIGQLTIYQIMYLKNPIKLPLGVRKDNETSGQSYKQFTLVIYDSRVVIWGIFKSGTTLES